MDIKKENWESVYSYKDWKKKAKEILDYLIQIFNISFELMIFKKIVYI